MWQKVPYMVKRSCVPCIEQMDDQACSTTVLKLAYMLASVAGNKLKVLYDLDLLDTILHVLYQELLACSLKGPEYNRKLV